MQHSGNLVMRNDVVKVIHLTVEILSKTTLNTKNLEVAIY